MSIHEGVYEDDVWTHEEFATDYLGGRVGRTRRALAGVFERGADRDACVERSRERFLAAVETYEANPRNQHARLRFARADFSWSVWANFVPARRASAA